MNIATAAITLAKPAPRRASTFEVDYVQRVESRRVHLSEFGRETGFVVELADLGWYIAHRKDGTSHGFQGPRAKDQAYAWATSGRADAGDIAHLQDRAEEEDPCRIPF